MYYFVYVKLDGEKRFSLANPKTLSCGIGKMYAPRYSEDDLPEIKRWIDAANKFPAATWQIRTTDGKKVYPNR